MGSIKIKKAPLYRRGVGVRLLLLLLLFTATATIGKAQSIGDWFNQAGEQKKYYLQQIAAFNAFESELKQGYGVVKNGLGGIRDINTAELNLYSTYYKSLSVASSAVKNNTQVTDILQWQSLIVSQFSGISLNGLVAGEQSYVAEVKTTVLKEVNQDMTDLQSLLQANNLQMSDGGRLKRLAKIHAAMLDKYQFTQSFCNSVKLLIAQRQQSTNDTQTLKSIYGNN
jgi:hypothetical protein